MPSFSQAISFLAAVALTLNATTIAHRVTRKNSKKNEAPPVCTWHNFAGSSKYENCQNIETEIKIECGVEDAEDTTRMCKVTDYPWKDEQKEEDTDAAAAAADACVVHGSFDPYTHITTDSATGFCHLKFVPLFDSCDVDADANGSPSGVFGMKAEIHNSRKIENHNDDNSGMLLRFSHNGGAKYYNVDDPRETVPLHGIIPAHRNLQSTCVGSAGCSPASGAFVGTSTSTYLGKRGPFETCYQFGDEENYCWTKSYLHRYYSNEAGSGDVAARYFQCVPNDRGESWHKVDPPCLAWVYVPYPICTVRFPFCGTPCQGQHEDKHSMMDV